ncbi:hypothetical protein D3C81_923540 [compost metagenome]
MLFNDLAVGIEERRHGLQHFRRLADVGDGQGGRGQVVGGGQPHCIAVIAVDRTDAQGAEGRRADEVALLPALGGRGQHRQAVLDVVQHVQHQVVPGPRGTGQRGGRGRGEQHLEVALAGQEIIQLGHQQCAGGVGLATHGPRIAQFQGQPLLVQALLGRVRRIDPGQLAIVAAQVDLVVVEGQRAADQVALEARGVIVHRRDVHVFRLAFIDQAGRGHRRATLPQLGHARVTGGGHRTAAEIGVDEHGVAVDPAQAALRFGAEEAVLDPALAGQVELAGDIGVGTAARQRDQAAAVVRTQAVGAVPDPVFVLGLVQRIQVEHGLPGRRGLAVLGQGGATPQAALVLLVLPEVVVVITDLLHAGNLGVRVEHLADAGLHLLEGRGLRQARLGLGVLFLDPGQRLVAGDVLQPGVTVGVFSGHGGTHRGSGHHAGQQAGGSES